MIWTSSTSRFTGNVTDNILKKIDKNNKKHHNCLKKLVTFSLKRKIKNNSIKKKKNQEYLVYILKSYKLNLKL